MGRSQRVSDQSTVWLRDLIQTMDQVSASKTKAGAGEVEALARRLELPALAVMADPLNRVVGHASLAEDSKVSYQVLRGRGGKQSAENLPIG
jgi:hypothetical protein